MKGWRVHIAAALALVATVGVGCGDDAGVTVRSSGSTASTAASSTSSTTATTTAATTAATTTTTPTTVPVTSPQTPTTTILTPIPAGWRDVSDVPAEAFPPCCASNWGGNPSPAMPESGDLADGIYHASRVGWSPDSAQLSVDVRRYDACGLLPAGTCQPLPEGYEYQPDELGIAAVPMRPMTVALDGNVRVVVVGWDTEPVARETNGVELAALLVELQRAYDEVIAAPFEAGEDPDSIIDGLLASASQGFGPPPVDMYGTLQYSYDGAPPILFQGAIDYTEAGERVLIDPTGVVMLTAIQFDHGVASLYFYAGFYP